VNRNRVAALQLSAVLAAAGSGFLLSHAARCGDLVTGCAGLVLAAAAGFAYGVTLGR
jgi:hypothetical protein